MRPTLKRGAKAEGLDYKETTPEADAASPVRRRSNKTTGTTAKAKRSAAEANRHHLDPYVKCPLCKVEFERMLLHSKHMAFHVAAYNAAPDEENKEWLDAEEQAVMDAYLALTEREKLNPKNEMFDRTAYRRGDQKRKGRGARNKLNTTNWAAEMEKRRASKAEEDIGEEQGEDTDVDMETPEIMRDLACQMEEEVLKAELALQAE